MELSLMLLLLLSSPVPAFRLTWRDHDLPLLLNERASNGSRPSATPTSGLSSKNSSVPVPPANCRFTDDGLVRNITSSCDAAIKAIQTCPRSGGSVEELLRAATSFSDCFEKQLYTAYACSAWLPREGGAISLWKPFGHPSESGYDGRYIEPLPAPTIEKGDCNYPDFLPIIQEACSPLMAAVKNQFGQCCNSTTSRLSIDGNNQVRDLVACMVQGSREYVRCTNTVLGDGDVRSCVISSAPKAAYLPPGIFVYDGSSVCKPFTFMMVYIAAAYVIDILEVFVLRFKNGKLWLVPYPQQGFSLYRLLLHIISHISRPFIMAAIVSDGTSKASAVNELALFLMSPRASPVIALICAFIPGWRGFGAQCLVSDIIFAFITIFGWGVVPGTPIETTHQNAGAPSHLVNVYNLGVQLAVMPNWLVICLVILIVSCVVFFSSKGNRARRIGNIIGVAICVAIVLASMPFVALYEFIYGVKERREQRKAWEHEQQQIALGLINDVSHHILGSSTTNPYSSSYPQDPDEKPSPATTNQRKLSRFALLFPKLFRLVAPDLTPPKPHLGWLKSIFRAFFPEDSPNSRRAGYGLLLLSSFCITVGNWMATVTLLNMAQESFCPSNVWALVLAHFGISLARIITDFLHVP